MKQQIWVLSLALIPTLAHADGVVDTVKNLAGNEKVQAAAKSAAGKAVDAVKGNNNKPAAASTSPGGGTPAGGGTAVHPTAGKSVSQIELEFNNRFLIETRRNACTFKGTTTTLAPGCDPKMQQLAAAINDAKRQLSGAGAAAAKFEVSGHTDSHGSAVKNKALSAKRAAVIVQQLVAKGVPAADLIAIGMGSEKPLVTPDNTAEAQAENRRYEVHIKL